MGILDELFRRKPEDEFLPQYAKPEEMTMEQVIQAAAALAPSVPKSEKPADPLRWAADAVGQNKDLPAPQFFMDPRSLSMRNMLHSGLNTTANWLDGTKDPSLVGPEEMVSPTGIGIGMSMGTGVRNAMTRPSRDHQISAALGRQYPDAVAGGEMREVGRKIVVDDGKRQSWAEDPHLERAWNAAGGQLRQRNQGRKHFIEPANVNTPGPYSVMADNAKGSAPGTIINSINQDFAGLSKEQKIAVAREMFPGAHHASLKTSKDVERWIEESYFDEMRRTSVLGTSADDARSAYSNQLRDAIAKARGGGSVLADNAKGSAPGTVVNSMAAQNYDAMSLPQLKALAKERGLRNTLGDSKAGWVETLRSGPRNALDESMYASPSASAPGLAANSTQQPKDASQLSEPMLMELLRKLEEGA